MKELIQEIEDKKDDMVKALVDMCRIPAIAPESGGDGEAEKADYLIQLLKDLGISDVELIKISDDRVSAGYRPNIIATVKGADESLPPLWIVSHIDIVPVGEISLWDVDPFAPVVKDGMVIGRGVSDNGQSLIASIFAVRAILSLGMKPRRTVKLALVADEEVGSKMGIQALIEKGLYTKDDLIIVPDHGMPDGKFMMVVEKAHMQLKIITVGKQAHASTPHRGLNAFAVASNYISRLTPLLYEKFNTQDTLFDPPISTFEATKKEPNVENINTIPGEDTFYMDCRLLPSENIDEIMQLMKSLANEIEQETGAKITIEGIRVKSAPPGTPTDSQIIINLQQAINQVMGINAHPMGTGGGTCASFFREAGLPAVVWSVIDNCAHATNEYCKINNMLNDAKVFGALCLM